MLKQYQYYALIGIILIALALVAGFIRLRYGMETKKETVSSQTEEPALPMARKPSDKELQEMLTPLQYAVTRKNQTEPPFTNEYAHNDKPGIYVDEFQVKYFLARSINLIQELVGLVLRSH